MKNKYNIKSVEVTQTIVYSPTAYIENCEEYGDTPTQEGFIDYAMDWAQSDFSSCEGEQNAKVLEE
jgi:hypothetical protein